MRTWILAVIFIGCGGEGESQGGVVDAGLDGFSVFIDGAVADQDIDATPAVDAALDAAPLIEFIDREPGPFTTLESAADDVARARKLGIMVYAPEGVEGSVPVILVSHGGDGSERGHHKLVHLGSTYASYGYLAIHVGHRTSDDEPTHRTDRPADISFVLDQLTAGNIELPPTFIGQPDLSRVGHAGHSWGAYTAHTVAGGTFDQGTFRDPRILAIAPISPQGSRRFGAYNRGPDDNTWRTVSIPAYLLTGEAELRGPPGVQDDPEWRLEPYENYPDEGDNFLSVLPGQDHGQMGSGGSDPVKAYIAENTRQFFDVYVAGLAVDPCEIGQIGAPGDIVFQRKSDPEGKINSCP